MSKKQIGGTHYKGYAIQPYEFISKNNLNFFQGVCIKYIVRYLKKGKVEDLKKVKHYCDLEIKRLEEKLFIKLTTLKLYHCSPYLFLRLKKNLSFLLT